MRYEIKTDGRNQESPSGRVPGRQVQRAPNSRGSASPLCQRASWTDGPTEDAVSTFCGQFNDTDPSRHDTMTDLFAGSQYTSIYDGTFRPARMPGTCLATSTCATAVNEPLEDRRGRAPVRA